MGFRTGRRSRAWRFHAGSLRRTRFWSWGRRSSLRFLPSQLRRGSSLRFLPSLLRRGSSLRFLPNLLRRGSSVRFLPNLLRRGSSLRFLSNLLRRGSSLRFLSNLLRQRPPRRFRSSLRPHRCSRTTRLGHPPRKHFRMPRHLRWPGRRSLVICRQRTLHRNLRRPPMIYPRKLSLVTLRPLHLRDLGRHRRHPLLMQCRQLRSRRPQTDATRPPVITRPRIGNVRHPVVINIHVPNQVHVHIRYRPVVSEIIPVPVAPVIPSAGITEAIIDAPIKPDVRAPVTLMPPVPVLVRFPIRRRPKRPNIRSNYPRSRHPVITSRPITPNPRSPYIVLAGA